MDHLWQILVRAAENEDAPLACEDCIVVLDYLTDLLADGYSSREVLPIAEKYLERCPDCSRQYQQAFAELASVVQARPIKA